MTIRCSNCGFDNRDTANFCGKCTQRLLRPAQSPAPLLIQPQQLPAQALQQPLAPQVPAQLAPTSAPSQVSWWNRLWAPALEGLVVKSHEQDVPRPRDASTILTLLAIAAIVLPPLLSSLLVGMGLAIVFILLGGGACLMMMFGMLGLFGKFASVFLGGAQLDHRITKVQLSVEDANKLQTAVVMYGSDIGGRLSQGDVIMIYG
jgi:hypothetical protein